MPAVRSDERGRSTLKERISVFVIPPFNCSSADGGAENICRLICLSLSTRWEVIVFHSEPRRNVPLGTVRQLQENLYSCNAFYLDAWTRERGEVSPAFCESASKLICESKLLISFERCIMGISIPQITVLGGISYLHCRDVAKSKAWERLIVPSQFIKAQCCQLRKEADGITVIYNGIHCDAFFPIRRELMFRVLLPFRPDRGKGFWEAVDFVSTVNAIGAWGQYGILITRLENASFADADFYQDIEHYAKEKRVAIEYFPWCQTVAMNGIYNRADFVLALGTVEEGFGLTTIESVLAGRPVITRKLGATPEILPSGFGTVFTEPAITYETVASCMKEVTSERMKDCLSAGGEYIRANYDAGRMCAAYSDLVCAYME